MLNIKSSAKVRRSSSTVTQHFVCNTRRVDQSQVPVQYHNQEPKLARNPGTQARLQPALAPETTTTMLALVRPPPSKPSFRNRPGKQMSLFSPDTYQRPDAEVLPLITPAAARATNSYGDTWPLHWAARNSTSVAVVQAIFTAYPEAAKATTIYGDTPLHLAAGNSTSVAVVQAIFTAYPEAVKATTIDGDTPLHKAARNSSTSVAVVQALL